MDKLTNRKALEYVIANCELPSAYVDKINAMIESLAKKSSSSGKPTATQKANEDLKVVLLESMTSEPRTITEIIKATPKFVELELSNQKVSALMKQLVDAQKVQKTTEKGKSLFFI